jgi:hypothetical protein
MPDISPVYRPHNPQNSAYYRCVEDHFETFEQVYEERFERQYGFFRPYVRKVIYRYLDCGILHNGFARVKCGDCGHEYLLAFSCKRRHFCPSCHQKTVIEFGEWLCQEVIKAIPHRHFIFSIPKILKRLGLWEIKARPPPRVTGPLKIQEDKIHYSTSQLPVPARRPVGGSDKRLYVDPDYPEACPNMGASPPSIQFPAKREDHHMMRQLYP